VIDFQEARRILQAYLREQLPDVQVVVAEILSRPYGWAFLVQSQAYMETADMRQMLLGTGPILVLGKDGRIIQLGTASSPEEELLRYERLGY
jgi:hypothetical protein